MSMTKDTDAPSQAGVKLLALQTLFAEHWGSMLFLKPQYIEPTDPFCSTGGLYLEYVSMENSLKLNIAFHTLTFFQRKAIFSCRVAKS